MQVASRLHSFPTEGSSSLPVPLPYSIGDPLVEGGKMSTRDSETI
jgi:hypothetical protein